MKKDIDQVFWPARLAVSQLRSGADVDDGTALYRRACQWVDSAREALREMGYSDHSVEHMLYTQCALLDESVLNRNRQDSGYITGWPHHCKPAISIPPTPEKSFGNVSVRYFGNPFPISRY